MSPQANIPRLLSKAEAAEYCGLSIGGFSHWIGAGKIPRAVVGSRRWDRKAIDLALDRLSNIENHSPQSALDQWRKEEGGGCEA